MVGIDSFVIGRHSYEIALQHDAVLLPLLELNGRYELSAIDLSVWIGYRLEATNVAKAFEDHTANSFARHSAPTSEFRFRLEVGGQHDKTVVMDITVQNMLIERDEQTVAFNTRRNRLIGGIIVDPIDRAYMPEIGIKAPVTFITLVAFITFITLFALATLISLFALISFVALFTLVTVITLVSLVTIVAFRSLWSRHALRASPSCPVFQQAFNQLGQHLSAWQEPSSFAVIDAGDLVR